MKKLIPIFLMLFVLSISSISAQGNNSVALVGSTDDPCMSPVFSPDGSMIAFTKLSYQGIWIYELNSASVKQVTDEVAAGFGMKWSADSKSILTRVAKYEDVIRYNAVKVFDVEDNSSKQLSDYRTSMPHLPQWSPTGNQIILPTKDGFEYFETDKTYNLNIDETSKVSFIVNNNILVKDLAIDATTTLNPIADKQYLNLSTSPDGSKIVFEIYGGNLFVANIDGSGLVDLGIGYRASWSADSKSLVYMITEDDGHDFTSSDIFIINSDGSGKKNITNSPDILEMNPVFAPDSKAVAFDVINSGTINLLPIE